MIVEASGTLDRIEANMTAFAKEFESFRERLIVPDELFVQPDNIRVVRQEDETHEDIRVQWARDPFIADLWAIDDGSHRETVARVERAFDPVARKLGSQEFGMPIDLLRVVEPASSTVDDSAALVLEFVHPSIWALNDALSRSTLGSGYPWDVHRRQIRRSIPIGGDFGIVFVDTSARALFSRYQSSGVVVEHKDDGTVLEDTSDGR